MKLAVRPLENKDNIEAICAIFQEKEMLTTNYANSRDIWDFQYVNNPEKRSWSTLIYDQEDNQILGHFGVIPFPVRMGTKIIEGGCVSGLAISKKAEGKSITQNGKPVFAVYSLIEQCCKKVFEDKIDLIFNYSRIAPAFWKGLQFKQLSFVRVETWHLLPSDLYKQYVGELQQRVNGYLKIFIRPYAFALTVVQQILKCTRGVNQSLGLSHVAVTEFKEFDRDIEQVVEAFDRENQDVTTFDRRTDFLNWRFHSNAFSKFKFIADGRLIGYCILFGSDMYDFIILKSYFFRIPEILNAVAVRSTFRFRHYLSCAYSRRVFVESAKQGYQMFFTFGEIIRNKFNKEVREPAFYYKTNTLSPLAGEIEQKLNMEEGWLINPLFYGPRYFK